jgi:alkanesulfonate monooxygenase SsuD/methylene tetrahydromethanopterin reductase-like flavin-dependent oxidoreductase (luciferase family)
VWVCDELVANPRLEAVTTLAAIAARTERVRLGVCCLATFPLRQPVLFAATWASLKALSSGRTHLPPSMVTSPASARSLSSPGQDPCPIWIASNPNPERLSPELYLKAIDRVALRTDGWQTAVTDPATFGRQWDRIRARAADHGRGPHLLRSSAHLMVNLADTVEEGCTAGKAFLDRYHTRDTPPEIMDCWGAYGDADTVAARIMSYVDRGLDIPILRMASNNQTTMLERVREELVPRLGVAA